MYALPTSWGRCISFGDSHYGGSVCNALLMAFHHMDRFSVWSKTVVPMENSRYATISITLWEQPLWKVGLEQPNCITIVSVWNLPIVKKYGFDTGISPVLRSLSRFLSRWAVQRILCASVFFVVIISPNNETTTDTSEEFKIS